MFRDFIIQFHILKPKRSNQAFNSFYFIQILIHVFVDLSFSSPNHHFVTEFQCFHLFNAFHQ